MSGFDTSAAYRNARGRIADLVRGAGGNATADVAVPASPAWTVQNVIAHLSGLVADALSGNMAGAPGEEWTGAQVARGQGKSVELLLEEWADEAPGIEAALAGPDGGRMTALVMDVHAHEQDLRGALGVPGERSGPFYDWAAPMLIAGFRARADGADLPTVRVVTDAGSIGDDDDPVTLRATQWDMFRAVLGRRSAAQIAALGWTGTDDPSAYVESMRVFGPAVADVVE